MDLKAFITKVFETPEEIAFADTINVIEAHYAFKPTAFENGALHNEAGQNNGSCKIFAFAQLHGLSVDQTLHCFGTYYREDVLNDPEGDSHQNIRSFMKSGWSSIRFDDIALERV